MAEEVRRCASCGQSALVSVRAWQHTHFGAASNIVTYDCQCQSCGTRVTLQPRARILGFYIAGVLLLPTVIPGAIVLWMAISRSRAWKRNPVVPGAPMPAMRFQSGPGNRRCGCGGTATMKKVTRHTHNGIPTGTEYEYACGSCGKGFVIESFAGLFFSFLGASVLAAVSYAVIGHVEKPLSRWGWGLGLALLALLLAAQASSRIAAYFRHPTI